MFRWGAPDRYDLKTRFDLESASCPLDPLFLSTVPRNRPLLPFDSVSKSTLGPHPPPIVPTWPDLGTDNAHFAKFWIYYHFP